ncbi:outer membrane protein [Bartonella sp. CB175]|uniref:outer membrane protein n=1 Tax=Bartonella sp. CB175 TaxID=3112256 RepID=UPI00300E4B06
MITKYLSTTSIVSLILVSVAQAADITVPEHLVPVVVTPSFSWTGWYLGGQLGGFSSKTTLSYLKNENTEKWDSAKKEIVPKPSGIIGGIYVGSNIDIDNNFIIGVDTDIMWSDKKDTKNINLVEVNQKNQKKLVRADDNAELEVKPQNGDPVPLPLGMIHHTLKQKWFGATRVRVGFVSDRMMPYIAGGVAYTHLQSIYGVESDAVNRAADFSDTLYDEKKTMVGYTVGGGVDFAMTDSVILRAEYRYSDFGKKKFSHEKMKIGYKTNDFRIGVAYKF